MQITIHTDLADLAERMGGTPSADEAKTFKALLLARGVTNTDTVTEAEWVAWQEENARTLACTVCKAYGVSTPTKPRSGWTVAGDVRVPREVRPVCPDCDRQALRYRGKAFSSEGPGTYRVLVTSDGDVLVWDSIAGHYTRCHALTPSAQARLRVKARRSC